MGQDVVEIRSSSEKNETDGVTIKRRRAIALKCEHGVENRPVGIPAM